MTARFQRFKCITHTEAGWFRAWRELLEAGKELPYKCLRRYQQITSPEMPVIVIEAGIGHSGSISTAKGMFKWIRPEICNDREAMRRVGFIPHINAA